MYQTASENTDDGKDDKEYYKKVVERPVFRNLHAGGICAHAQHAKHIRGVFQIGYQRKKDIYREQYRVSDNQHQVILVGGMGAVDHFHGRGYLRDHDDAEKGEGECNLTEQVSGKEHDDHEDVSRIDNEVEFLLRAAYTY